MEATGSKHTHTRGVAELAAALQQRWLPATRRDNSGECGRWAGGGADSLGQQGRAFLDLLKASSSVSEFAVYLKMGRDGGVDAADFAYDFAIRDQALPPWAT